MNLSTRRWHVRWFHFIQSKIGDDKRYVDGTNLCHFMRVTMLWGPLVVAFSVGAVGLIGLVLTVLLILLPYEASGILGVLGLWLGLITTAVVGYGLILLIGRIGSKLSDQGTFTRCAWEHAVAVKGKFCPLISFSDDNSTSQTKRGVEI